MPASVGEGPGSADWSSASSNRRRRARRARGRRDLGCRHLRRARPPRDRGELDLLDRQLAWIDRALELPGLALADDAHGGHPGRRAHQPAPPATSRAHSATCPRARRTRPVRPSPRGARRAWARSRAGRTTPRSGRGARAIPAAPTEHRVRPGVRRTRRCHAGRPGSRRAARAARRRPPTPPPPWPGPRPCGRRSRRAATWPALRGMSAAGPGAREAGYGRHQLAPPTASTSTPRPSEMVSHCCMRGSYPLWSYQTR
jgi:hypothetical protein